MRMICLAAILLAASGCGGDDPSNPPKLGHWARDQRLSSASVNGMGMTRGDLPKGFPTDGHEDMGCTEPRIRSLEAANAVIAQGTHGQCKVSALDGDGSVVTGEGRCDFAARGHHLGGKFTLVGEQSAERARLVQTADLFVHEESGSTNQARMTYVLEWKRLGDCG